MTRGDLLADLASLRVAVVGDLIVDRYIHAEPKAVSREAPVMVLRHRSEHLGAGGAANVARNALALGASVRVLGAVGRDRQGRDLVRMLEEAGADVADITFLDAWETPMKTRVLAGEAHRSPRQVLRLDRDPGVRPPRAWRARIAARLSAITSLVDVVLVSDYAYGSVGAEVGAAALEAAESTVVVLDPRDSLDCFRRGAGPGAVGLAAVTPNQGELAAFAGVSHQSLDEDEALADAAWRVSAAVGCEHLLVTRGNRGMALFGDDQEGLFVPVAGEGEVIDVCGAGDTAAAIFAMTLAAGRPASEAMAFANAAGGHVVMETGAVVCPPDALARAMMRAPGAGGRAHPSGGSPAPGPQAVAGGVAAARTVDA